MSLRRLSRVARVGAECRDGQHFDFGSGCIHDGDLPIEMERTGVRGVVVVLEKTMSDVPSS